VRKLSAFIFITLDGYFEGPGKGDVSWHRHGPEENAYALEGLKSGSALLFGRVTYDMMAGYWPTPLAMKNDPVVAEAMNRADKIVFSRTLDKAAWSGTTVVTGDLGEEVRKLKRARGKDMTLLGSGSVLTQLAEQGLVDEYQIMVDPVILGSGSKIFGGLGRKLDLDLESTRTFKSGVVLLGYRPRAGA
jgi:dihydrofolate reductase